MSVLYCLEGLRNSVLDGFFSVVTLLGEETFFMAIAMIIFWCVDKYQGYYQLAVGFMGTVLNQFLKILCRIPRPWVLDPKFTIVESAREAATGYSFPSGHTQCAVGVFGGLARWNKGKAVKIVSLCACLLVPLSRMYLGVHTPLDVGVSFVIALVLVFGAYPMFQKAKDSPKLMLGILGTLTGIALGFLLFTELYPFPADVDAENLLSAQKNGYTLFGCMMGLTLSYEVDRRWIRFSEKGCAWVQVLKASLGIVVVLLVKEGMKLPLDFIFGDHLAGRAVRYFFVVVTAGVIWPLSFPFFQKLQKKTEVESNEV